MTLLSGICLIASLLIFGAVLWPVTFPRRYFRFPSVFQLRLSLPMLSAKELCEVQPMTITLDEPCAEVYFIDLEYKEEELPRVPLYEPPEGFRVEG